MGRRGQHANSNLQEVFGQLEKVYRIKRGFSENYIIPAILFLLFLFSLLLYFTSEDWLTIPVCVVPFFLLFCGLVWNLFISRRDELRIYENGFTLHGNKNFQTCLWSEIKSYDYRERLSHEIETLKEGSFPLDWIEKKNGEKIFFDSNLEGTDEILKRFEQRNKTKKKK